MGKVGRPYSYKGEMARLDIMQFMTAYYLENGFPPTIDMITESVDGLVSKSTTFYHINVLVDRGELRAITVKGKSHYVPANCKVVQMEESAL
jgi:hypothetical protein